MNEHEELADSLVETLGLIEKFDSVNLQKYVDLYREYAQLEGAVYRLRNAESINWELSYGDSIAVEEYFRGDTEILHLPLEFIRDYERKLAELDGYKAAKTAEREAASAAAAAREEAANKEKRRIQYQILKKEFGK